MFGYDKFSVAVFTISFFYCMFSTIKKKKIDRQTEYSEDFEMNEKHEVDEIQDETLSEEEGDAENMYSDDSFVCNIVLKNIPVDCTLHKAFLEINAKDLFYDRKVLFFNTDVKIYIVLQQLLEERCSCCVVTDKKKKIYGIVDTSDIVAFIINNGYNDDVKIASFVRKLIYVYEYTNLLDITQYLKHGVRYIIVKNSVTSIISQGSILRYIHHNKMLMEQDDILNASVINLNICKNQKILTASLFEGIIEAYERMNSHNITSMPVVDNDNMCVTILSNSDIKHISSDNVYTKCGDYLNRLRKNNNIILTFDDFDTIDYILSKMIHFDVHHLYKLDEQKCPVGVISYVDIIKALF